MGDSRTTSALHTVIWDADGVLFNTFDEQGRFRWSKNIVEDLKIDTAVFAHIFSPAWEEVLRGVRDVRTHIAGALTEAGSSIAVDDFIAYWLAKDSSVNWDIASHLHPARACIGTNQDPLRAALIGRLFAKHASKVFASSAMGFLKREEGFYRFIERDLNLAPKQLCLIDDSMPNLDAAGRCGWTAHRFTGLAPLEAFLSEHGLLLQTKQEERL